MHYWCGVQCAVSHWQIQFSIQNYYLLLWVCFQIVNSIHHTNQGCDLIAAPEFLVFQSNLTLLMSRIPTILFNLPYSLRSLPPLDPHHSRVYTNVVSWIPSILFTLMLLLSRISNKPHTSRMGRYGTSRQPPRAPKNSSYAPEVETIGPSNRKRKPLPMRGQSTPINKQIRIQKSPIKLDEDEDDRVYWILDNEPAEDSDCVEIKPPPQTECSRSLSTIPDRLQGLVWRAQIQVTNHTLFTMPFLSPVELLFVLADVWEHAQDTERRYEAKTKAVNSYVSICCQ